MCIEYYIICIIYNVTMILKKIIIISIINCENRYYKNIQYILYINSFINLRSVFFCSVILDAKYYYTKIYECVLNVL